MNGFALYREKAGLKQEEAALAIGVERSTISKWETGAAKPRADKLVLTAKVYKCTIDDLIREDGKGGKAS